MASDDKYDRQVRLWGSHGQKKLAQAHIILLGTSSAGTETLKNLILPGIGKFTIVDDALVTLRDCGNNFFVTHENIGKPKAEVVCSLLGEMNPDCQGNAVVMSVQDFVAQQESALIKCQLIVACDIDNVMAIGLGSICETSNAPLVILRNYGMLGYMRLYKRENCIMEAKDYATNKRDLRVHAPFQELLDLCDTFKLDEMTAADYLHTPYVIILIKARQQWMSEHEGLMPQSQAQKKEFVELIKKFIKYPQENNIQEALSVYTDCFTSTDLSFEMNQLINDERCDRQMADDFWLFAAALKQFWQNYKTLPVSGSVPDMVGTTVFYQSIQRCYQAKAAADRQIMHDLVQKIAADRKMRLKSFPDLDQRLALFCKGVGVRKMVQVIDSKSIAKEISEPDWSMSVQPGFWGGNISGPCWMLCMRAFEALKVQNPKFGEADQDPDQEFAQLRQEVDILVESVQANTPVDDKYIKELVRNGKSFLHCTSSFLGGIGAQEAVKLMMSQYIPLNHTFVYDGISGNGSVFNL